MACGFSLRLPVGPKLAFAAEAAASAAKGVINVGFATWIAASMPVSW
jgi:hypothetical protein